MTDAQMMPPIMGGSPGTVDKQVAASGDDGIRIPGDFYVTDAVDAIGISSGNFRNIFARWIGVTYEGTVDVSYIEGYAHNAGAGTALLKIYGVDANNPNAPKNANQFDLAPLTTAATDWDGAWNADLWNQSPSCNSWLQELVDTHGPFTNTAIMAQIKNDGGTGTNFVSCRMWDYADNLHGLKLHIEYSTSNGRRLGHRQAGTNSNTHPSHPRLTLGIN